MRIRNTDFNLFNDSMLACSGAAAEVWGQDHAHQKGRRGPGGQGPLQGPAGVSGTTTEASRRTTRNIFFDSALPKKLILIDTLRMVS